MGHDFLTDVGRVPISSKIVSDILALEATDKIECLFLTENVNVVLEVLSLAVDK